MRHLILPAGLAGLLLLTACSTSSVAPPTKQASSYFQEGEALFEDGHYQDAIASWEKVRESYYSPELNILAEMKIAEAYFADEKYLEAGVAYETFLKNHPGHARAQDALYRLGLCYLRQILDVDQDQTATRQALATFRSLLQQYPQNPHRDEVAAYIDHCLFQLAANEIVVGRYYLKAGKYLAAIKRFERVLKDYPGHVDVAEVYYHLGRAYLLAGEKDRSGEAFTLLFNQYPYSEYSRDAETFIRKQN
jgi:outer membrane protein assembly factor BamD